MKTQPGRASSIDKQHLSDAMPATNNQSIEDDEQNDHSVSSEEEGDSITKQNEEVLLEAVMKMKIEKLRRSCPGQINSSSSSSSSSLSTIRRPLHTRAASAPPRFFPKSIMLVRTNDESLRRKTLRHHHRRKTDSDIHKINGFVAFMSVQVQEYPIILGDNPSVSSGPPVTIDWTPLNNRTYKIDKYEELRQPYRRHSSADLALPHSQRWYSLIRMGSSPTDVLECQEQATKEREKRLKCLSLMSVMTFGLQARMELTCRGMKNVVLRGRKVNQRKWIEQGLESDRQAFQRRSEIFLSDHCDDQSVESEDEHEFCKAEVDVNDCETKKADFDCTSPLKFEAISVGSSAAVSKALTKDAKDTKISIPSSRPHVAKSA